MEYIQPSPSPSTILHFTYTVIDGEENLENPQEFCVDYKHIINYPLSYSQANFTANDFALAPGTKVLALWPQTTAFYEAIVLPRNNVPVDDCQEGGEWQDTMILVQFEGYSPVSLLYHDVIPFKAAFSLVC